LLVGPKFKQWSTVKEDLREIEVPNFQISIGF